MFNQDLKDGKIYEHKVCRYIQRKYPQAQVIDGEHKEGDIYIPETDTWIEVKHDRLVGKTGNFFVEVEYEGEDSGIRTSESEWWALCDDDTAYVIPIEILRNILRIKRPIERIINLKQIKGCLVTSSEITYNPYVSKWKLI